MYGIFQNAASTRDMIDWIRPASLDLEKRTEIKTW